MRTKVIAAVGVLALAGTGTFGGLRVADALSACEPSVTSTLNPGASIANAIRDAPSCSAIELKGGSYPGVSLQDNLSKERVIVRSVAGEQAVIAGGFSSGRSGGSVTSPTGSKGIELWNLKVSGEIALKWGSERWRIQSVIAANMRITSASDVLVDDSSFGPFVDQVFTINSAGGSSPGVFDITVQNSYLHDYLISNAEKHAECSQVWPGAPSARVTFRNVYFRNCTDFGVLVKAPALTDMVFEQVSLDKPMTGSVATTTCNPDCARSGSSIRFSTHQYPGAKVVDSKLGGALVIDQPGFVSVVNTCTQCDPGSVPQIPSGTVTEPPPTTTTTTTTTEPPVPADREIFCNEFVSKMQAVPYYTKWTNQNPNEKIRWETFRDALCPSGSAIPPTMTTNFGTALVAAGKEAL